MNKVFVKLANGDMLVGVSLDTDLTGLDYIKIDKPHLVMLTSDQNGNPAVSFYDYNPFGQSDYITLDTTHISFIDLLSAEMTDHFDSFNNPSKLLTPKKPSIIV